MVRPPECKSRGPRFRLDDQTFNQEDWVDVRGRN